jgi:hypothetical protein
MIYGERVLTVDQVNKATIMYVATSQATLLQLTFFTDCTLSAKRTLAPDIHASDGILHTHAVGATVKVVTRGGRQHASVTLTFEGVVHLFIPFLHCSICLHVLPLVAFAFSFTLDL